MENRIVESIKSLPRAAMGKMSKSGMQEMIEYVMLDRVFNIHVSDLFALLREAFVEGAIFIHPTSEVQVRSLAKDEALRRYPDKEATP